MRAANVFWIAVAMLAGETNATPVAPPMEPSAIFVPALPSEGRVLITGVWHAPPSDPDRSWTPEVPASAIDSDVSR